MSVHIAYCHGGGVRGKWASCMMDLLTFDVQTRQIIRSRGVGEGLYIHKNRNGCCERFLDHCTEDWLFFVDTDMTFSPQQFHRLYDHAVENKCDIIGGLYFGFQYDGNIYPTWIERKPDGTMATCAEMPNAVREVDGIIGMGFTLIHRRVLQAMRDAKPNHHQAWFGHDEFIGPGDQVWDTYGEDTTFCVRAHDLGFKIHGDGSVVLGHDKTFVLDVVKYNQDQERRERERKEQESRIVKPDGRILKAVNAGR